MTPKVLLLFLVVVIIVSCNLSSRSDKEQDSLLSKFEVTDNKKAIGNWTMCSYSCNGTYITFNICQTVTFNRNGTGYISKNNEVSENFIWALKQNVLSISHAVQSSTNIFSDTTFTTDFSEDTNKHSMNIVQQNQGCFYSLSR